MYLKSQSKRAINEMPTCVVPVHVQQTKQTKKKFVEFDWFSRASDCFRMEYFGIGLIRVI